MGNLNLNLDEIEDAEMDFSPVPPGKYVCEVTESEVKVNSKGTGKICKVRAKVSEGEFKGRSLFLNFNVSHESVKAQQIGKAQFKSLCKSCGIISGEIEDSSELHGKKFGASVKLEDRGDYGEQNTVSYTFPIVAEKSAPDFLEKDDIPF